ncbi:hypothetical protein AB0H00_29405 [Nocardia sp. NPDC023852]|uniref:hypothetical protein n=1 Tax=Nocardia sp. NPDC023852 TaxID=3154697 RepID=UPI00341018DC
MFSTWKPETNPALTIGDTAHGVIIRSRVVEKLQDCPVPVLAIGGDDDHAGHSAALEQPEAVARYLDEHFALTEGV